MSSTGGGAVWPPCCIVGGEDRNSGEIPAGQHRVAEVGRSDQHAAGHSFAGRSTSMKLVRLRVRPSPRSSRQRSRYLHTSEVQLEPEQNIDQHNGWKGYFALPNLEMVFPHLARSSRGND